MSKLELIQDIENKADKSYVDTLPTADKIPSLAFSKQIYKQNESLNQDLVAGMYDFYNATDGFPDGYTTENDFYLFITAISTTELSYQRHILLDVRDNRTFSRSKRGGELTPWKEMATKDEVDSLSIHRGYLKSRIVVDANELTENGKYTSVRTNTPTNEMWNIEVIKHNDTFLTQVATLFANDGGFKKEAKMSIRNKGQGTWTDWQEVATTDRLDNLPLLNGWTLWGGSAYPPKVFKVGNICSIVGCIVGGTATSGTTVFTLPEGFRPKRTESTPVLGADGKVYNLNISLNGNANTDNSWGTTWTNSLKMINIVYEV